MDEYAQAQAQLSLVRDKGIDSPGLHHALGLALGELYRQSLEEARLRGGASWVAQQQQRLEKQYLEPALLSLERSRGLELESPRYLEGLIALYRRRYEEAIQAARQSYQETPWLYEALRLAGDAAHARALEQMEAGAYDTARAGFTEARGLYQQAAEHGRSDGRNHRALAETWLQQAELDERQGLSPQASLEQALAACEKALQAAPSRASGYTLKARVLMNRYRQVNASEDWRKAGPVLEEWLATAGRAVELDPKDVYAYDMLGYGHFLRGLRQVREGQEPGPAWEEAISWLKKALALQPAYPWAHHDLALVHRWRGDYLREHGQDVGDAYPQAEHHFREAARSDPRYLLAHHNLAALHNTVAEFLLERGSNPQAQVDAALQAGQQALSLDNRYHPTLNILALAELTAAKYLAESGGDPQPPAGRALKHLERSLSLNPQSGWTYLYLARVHLLLGESALKQDGDPGAALSAGRQALGEAYRRAPQCVDCLATGGRLGLAEAAWAKRRGQPSVPVLRQALAEAQRAVEVFPFAEGHQVVAEACWRLAEALPPEEALRRAAEGLGQVEQALRMNGRLPRAHLTRGGLLLVRARLGRVEAERVDAARQAEAAVQRALTLNPLLRAEGEELLRQALQSF